MPEIIPIRDLKNTSKISEKCNKIDEPVFITKNGYGDMVIMSMRTYEKTLGRIEVYNKIQESKKQLEEGNIVDGEDFLKRLKDKYAL